MSGGLVGSSSGSLREACRACRRPSSKANANLISPLTQCLQSPRYRKIPQSRPQLRHSGMTSPCNVGRTRQPAQRETDCQGPAMPGDQPGVNHILSHFRVCLWRALRRGGRWIGRLLSRIALRGSWSLQQPAQHFLDFKGLYLVKLTFVGIELRISRELIGAPEVLDELTIREAVEREGYPFPGPPPKPEFFVVIIKNVA